MSKRKIWISYENEFTKLKIDPVVVEDIDDLRNEIVKHLQLKCPVVNVKLKRGGVPLLDPSAAIPQGFTTTGDALQVYVSSAEQKKNKQQEKNVGQALNEEQKKLQVEEQKKLQERKSCLDTDAKNLEISQRKERSVRKQYKSEMDTLLSQIRVLHDSEKQLKDQIRNLKRAWRPNESKEGAEGEAEGELVAIEGPVAAAPGGPPAASASKKKKKKKKRNKNSRNSTKGENAELSLCEKKFIGVSNTEKQINELHKQREELKIKRAALFKEYEGVKQVDHAIATKLSSLSSQMRGVEQELKDINLELQV